MRRFPDWLRKQRFPKSPFRTEAILENLKLHTVCESAKCPNRQECYSHSTATFMILGDVCTRKCGFCSISAGKPSAIDWDEPRRVAEASRAMGLRHVVITSVARDDQEDGGAELFYQTIRSLKSSLDEVTVEVLTPDFKGRETSIERICDAAPDIYNHNVETVARLSPNVRSPNADYNRSLKLLRHVKNYRSNILTKSGIMLGLSEKKDEVLATLFDLRQAGCDILTMGQYLKPEDGKLDVQEFVHPDVFSFYESKARQMGFREAYCGPFVRSSYHAAEVKDRTMKRESDYVYA